MDVRTLFAAQKYAASQAATRVDENALAAENGVRATVQNFEQTLQNADTVAQAALVGKADPHALVHALAQSELAVETAVTVRNRVVEAYQEILRMPV